MHDVGPGTYAVTATAGELIGVSFPIVVPAGAAITDVVVHLGRGGRLEVHLKNVEDEQILLASSGGAIVAFVQFNEPSTSSTPEILLPEGKARIMLGTWGQGGYEILDEATVYVVARERRSIELDGSG